MIPAPPRQDRLGNAILGRIFQFILVVFFFLPRRISLAIFFSFELSRFCLFFPRCILLAIFVFFLQRRIFFAISFSFFFFQNESLKNFSFSFQNASLSFKISLFFLPKQIFFAISFPIFFQDASFSQFLCLFPRWRIFIAISSCKSRPRWENWPLAK